MRKGWWWKLRSKTPSAIMQLPACFGLQKPNICTDAVKQMIRKNACVGISFLYSPCI